MNTSSFTRFVGYFSLFVDYSEATLGHRFQDISDKSSLGMKPKTNVCEGSRVGSLFERQRQTEIKREREESSSRHSAGCKKEKKSHVSAPENEFSY